MKKLINTSLFSRFIALLLQRINRNFRMKLSCHVFTFVAVSIYCEAFQDAKLLSGRRRELHSLYGAANNNIVLKPSEDKEAFDSLKVGGCRVHRYERDGIESETEYVMWYHGRSIAQDEDKTLPPLSTGRIGRATSKNGLSWEKDTAGSVDSDMPGTSLGLNTDSWWGFDTAHVGLGNVLLPMSTPAIMTEGGVYLMYYMGGNLDVTPIGDYTNKEMPDDATIKGMKMKIGVAVSQDGSVWGRVEGDDPSGACMVPFDQNDPNSIAMAVKTDDDGNPLKLKEELYCGWPDVVPYIDDTNPEKSGFLMYYSTMLKDTKEKCVGSAVSADGFRWYKRELAIVPDEGTMDDGGCARCTAYRNAEYDSTTKEWSDASGYKMFYEGVSTKDNKHRIMMAESMDGKKWTKKGVVLDVGESDDSWDCMGVGSPHILRMDDGSQRMYYTGQGPDGSTAIGVAKCERGSLEWLPEQASIVFSTV
eukprot:scaffold2353_cov134-Cylindrotheca_fusiformis.AAC.4